MLRQSALSAGEGSTNLNASGSFHTSQPEHADKSEVNAHTDEYTKDSIDLSNAEGKKMNIGFLLYPRITSLDLIGPHEILSRVGTPIIVGEHTNEFISDNQLIMKPNTDFENCPALDILVIPGGPGVDEASTPGPPGMVTAPRN